MGDVEEVADAEDCGEDCGGDDSVFLQVIELRRMKSEG
jgi:hypothetical protein